MKKKLIVCIIALVLITLSTCQADVTTANVNFRTGPTLDAKIITTLRKNTVVKILGKSGDWYEVSFEGINGFIHSRYVKAESATETTKVSTQMFTRVNSHLRTGPGTDTPSKKVIKQGQAVTVTGVVGDWYEVSFEGMHGYIFSNLLEKTLSSEYIKFDASTAASIQSGVRIRALTRVHLRTGPGSEHESIGIIPKGTELTVSSKSGGWLKVSFNGKVGWTYSQYYEIP